MKHLYTIITALAVLQGVAAQESTPSTTRNALDNIIIRTAIKQSLFPEERVYLHFDNTAYYLGEEMWFKAYVMSGTDNHPTTMSRVLYVELVAPEGYVVRTNKYRIGDDGCCHGSFELNQLLLSGYYEVRAYTRYMLNRGNDAVFSRVFPIFDKVNADNWDFKNMLDRRRAFLVDVEKNDTLTGLDRKMQWENGKLPEWDINFYPEGGHLVAGLESTVAFEIFGPDGINSSKEITLLADGKPLLTTQPAHLGMGTFRFVPQSNVKYTAQLNTGKRKRNFNLPEIEEHGAVINITDGGNTLHLNVINNLQHNTQIGCAIIFRGKTLFYEHYESSTQEMLFAIDKNNLNEGVNRAVIFIGDSIPLAERMFFVTHDKPLAADASTARLRVTGINRTLTPHEKITLNIEREDGKPIADGNFSLSVSDADYREQTSYTYNLYSYMLLGSEVKGYIPDAARYFDTTNANRNQELDLIMLTHGWTSYDWKKLSTRTTQFSNPVERGITIKGRFIKKTPERRWGRLGKLNITNQPNEQIKFEITYNDSTLTSYDFKTDDNGWFRIRTNDFTGKRVARLIPSKRTGFNDVDSIFAITLDRYFSPTMRLYHYWERNSGLPLTLEEKTKERDSIIKMRPFEYLISPIEVTSKRKRESYYRPPRSEMRLDFLDEWEYAQDVTYLRNEKSSWDYEEWQSNYAVSNMPPYPLAPTASIDDPNPELSSFDRHVMSGNMYNTITYNATVMGSGYNVDKDGTFTIMDPAYRNSLTAADILRSAFWRHNLNWCWWIQSMVVDSCYNPHTTPTPDEEYLNGVFPQKMLDFKEIIIRSDEKTRNQFGNGRHIGKIRNKRKLNTDYSCYYQGFYDRMAINARNGDIDDAPDAITLVQRAKEMPRNAIPNYVACFVPITEQDKQTSITPLLTQKSSTRYTMVYGYTQSKQFYSPNYCNIKPDASTADYRRTLLWEPCATAKNGKINIELYNNSSTRNICVDVEGYAQGTYYSNNGNITTRTKSEETEAPATVHIEMTPIAGIHNIDLLAHCFKLTEEGRTFFRHNMYDKAFSKFNEASALGYPDAIYNAGVCYINGYGVEPDSIEAFTHFLRAANCGHSRALHNLAGCYLKGIGTTANDTLALNTYKRAAATGFSRSQLALADCYISGTGTAKDSATAYEWYCIAAANNEARALYVVATHLATTDSLAAHSKRALRKSSTINYFKKAAKEGNAEAQYHLARFYHTGRYVRKSNKKAFEWYMHAANNNHPQAAEQVARCYEKGRGTKKDERKAVYWYRVALLHGSQLAKEKIDWFDKFHFLE